MSKLGTILTLCATWCFSAIVVHSQSLVSTFEVGASSNGMPFISGSVAYNTKPIVFMVEYRGYAGRVAPGSKDWRYYNTIGLTAGVALQQGRVYITGGAYAHLYEAPAYGYPYQKFLGGGSVKFHTSEKYPYGGSISAGMDGRQYIISAGFMGRLVLKKQSRSFVAKEINVLALCAAGGLIDYSRDIASVDYDRFAAVFDNLDPEFFNPKISWRRKYVDGDPAMGRNKQPLMLTDAYHAATPVTGLLRAVAITLVCTMDMKWWQAVIQAAAMLAADRVGRGVGELMYNR